AALLLVRQERIPVGEESARLFHGVCTMMWRASAELFVREAVRALSRNKLRSVLAAIAIMIGIGAVVCVVAIGRAGASRAEEQLRNLGENFVWVEAGSRAPSGVRTGPHGTTRLTLGDAEAIGRERPSASSYSATRIPSGR